MSDPINTAAEKFLILLSGAEEIVDEAAAATYDGDYWQDLANGSGEKMAECLWHNEKTYAAIARATAGKLEQSALDADWRAQVG